MRSSAVAKRTQSLRKRPRRVTPSRPLNSLKNAIKGEDNNNGLGNTTTIDPLNPTQSTINGPLRVKRTKFRQSKQERVKEAEKKEKEAEDGVVRFKLTNYFAENVKKSSQTRQDIFLESSPLDKTHLASKEMKFTPDFIESSLKAMAKPPSVTAPLQALGLFPWLLDGSIAKVLIGVLGNIRRQVLHNIYNLTKAQPQKQQQNKQEQELNSNPVFAAAGATRHGIEGLIDQTQNVLYKPQAGDAHYGKRLPFPFFRTLEPTTTAPSFPHPADPINPILHGTEGNINVLRQLFSHEGANGEPLMTHQNTILNTSPFILSLLGLFSRPNAALTLKQLNKRLVANQQVSIGDINKVVSSTLPYSLQQLIATLSQNKDRHSNLTTKLVKTNFKLNLPLKGPNRINAGLLSLMVGAPMGNDMTALDDRLKGLAKDANGLNKMQKNNFFVAGKNPLKKNNHGVHDVHGVHRADRDPALNDTAVDFTALENMPNLYNIGPIAGQSEALMIKMAKLRQVVNKQLLGLRKTNSKFAESLSSSLLNPLDLYMMDSNGKLSAMKKKLQLKMKAQRSLKRKIGQFYRRTFYEFSHLLSSSSPTTTTTTTSAHQLIQSLPLKPPQTMAEYPFFKDIFAFFGRVKSIKDKRNGSKTTHKRTQSLPTKKHTPSSPRVTQLLNDINTNNFATLKRLAPITAPQRAMSSSNTNTATQPTQNAPTARFKSRFLASSSASLGSKKSLKTQQQRSYRFMPQPKTERLRKMHISEHTESAPFHYHVADSLRAVTKFAYLRLSNPHEKLKIDKIRPVLMPFWGFQGMMTLQHKPSKTSKVVDYTDVERNLDTTIYTKMLNVREDQLVFGISSQHLVNPNCSFGDDFLHHETAMLGRKAETYINQPHTINTARMRAQQMYSGSEWAPWQMEGLKLHLQMVQEFKESHLDFPSDPLAPADFSHYGADYPEFDKKFDPSGGKSAVEAAERLRDGVSPLAQSYQETVKLEKMFPYIASHTIATPAKQSNIPLETDEHIRSERACLIESLVNMVSLEFNLVQRGVGVTTNHQHLGDDKLEEMNQVYQNGNVDHDPMNTAVGGDLKAIYDGAFLSLSEQRDMLHNLAGIHHKMNGTSGALPVSGGGDDESNPLQVPHYHGEKSALMKAHKYFKAVVNPVEKPQVDADGKPILKTVKKQKYNTNTDPIVYLQEQLLDEDFDLKYNDDNNDKQKKAVRHQQKEFRSQLRQNIINAFLNPQTTPSPLNNNDNAVSFDIPGSDYRVTFNGITSRKVMFPGYIHHYNYLGKQTIVSSGVTGVTAGVPHRHYKSVIKDAIKNTIGAGIGAVGLRVLMRRLVLPPIYTAALTTLLIVYSLREVIQGHWRYSSDHHQHGRALSREFEIEQDLYSAASRVGAGVGANTHGQSSSSSSLSSKKQPKSTPTADVMRDAWEFQPFDGFYTNNNWKSENIWNMVNNPSPQPNTAAANDTTSAQSSSSSSSSSRPRPLTGTAYRNREREKRHKQQQDEKYQEMKRRTAEAEKMRNMPAVIPTDPYLLILGEEYLGIKNKTTKSGKKQPVLRLSQVSQVPFEVVKAKYFEQIKYWHPDTHTDQSPEYASERTRKLIEAWQLIANKAKKDEYDRRHYS